MSAHYWTIDFAEMKQKADSEWDRQSHLNSPQPDQNLIQNSPFVPKKILWPISTIFLTNTSYKLQFFLN